MIAKQQKGGLVNLFTNIIIPSIILVKFSSADTLGPLYALLLALSFPLFFGIKELIQSKKWNAFSIIGLISVMLTGGIGLFELPLEWLAIKEASIPFIIGVVVLVSMDTKWSIVELILTSAINMDHVYAKLTHPGDQKKLAKTVRLTTYIIAASFFISAFLNYSLAKWIVTSPPGTEAFNAELGKMTALSFPVIALPSTIILVIGLFIFFMQIAKLTGTSLEELLSELHS